MSKHTEHSREVPVMLHCWKMVLLLCIVCVSNV